MFLICWMRIINDLAFYYAFAAFVVSFSGSAHCLIGLLLPSFFCTLSQMIRKTRPQKKGLRVAVSALSLICLFLPGLSVWDRIALIPVLVYTGYLSLSGSVVLSRENRKEVLSLFCRSYPLFFLLFSLLGFPENLLRYSAPCALLTLILCICLMRLLRHDEEVYSRPLFLAGSLLPPAALILLSCLLSLPVVLRSVRSAFLTVYTNVLVPILLIVLKGCAYVIFGIVSVLLSLFSNGSESSLDQTISMEEEDLSLLSEGAASPALPLLLLILKILGILLLILLAVCLLLRLFRRLAGGFRADQAGGASAEEIRHQPEHRAASANHHLSRSPLHPVNRIRREYRSYLKLCRQNGLNPPSYYTTRDIENASGAFFRDREPAAELRHLYLQARYHGSADAKDAARASQLVRQLVQEANQLSDTDRE